jgi:hypothetical protein
MVSSTCCRASRSFRVSLNSYTFFERSPVSFGEIQCCEWINGNDWITLRCANGSSEVVNGVTDLRHVLGVRRARQGDRAQQIADFPLKLFELLIAKCENVAYRRTRANGSIPVDFT